MPPALLSTNLNKRNDVECIFLKEISETEIDHERKGNRKDKEKKFFLHLFSFFFFLVPPPPPPPP